MALVDYIYLLKFAVLSWLWPLNKWLHIFIHFFISAKPSTYSKRKVEHEYINVADVKNRPHLSSQGGKRLPGTEEKKVRLRYCECY